MAHFELTAFPANNGTLENHLLPMEGGGCFVDLRNLPGATHIHIVVGRENEPVLRVEIPAHGGETVRVEFRLDADGQAQLNCPGRGLTRLPLKPALPPCDTPISPANPTDSLDLAIVVDATTRCFFRHPASGLWDSRPLLADAGRWQAHAAKLCGLVETMARQYPQCRVALLAFGDQPIPNVTAPELQPSFWLYPGMANPGLLRPLNRDRLKTELAAIEPSSGGDFVDALADALAACTGLHWKPSARKLVLLSGDSPGASLLWPVRKGGDACVREHDVDTQALRLHRLGVELLTVYHAPEPGFIEDLIGPPREFQRHAQEQYQRLAALPELAFIESQFQGVKEAGLICSLAGFIGHGGSFGELLKIESKPAGVYGQ